MVAAGPWRAFKGQVPNAGSRYAITHPVDIEKLMKPS